jgi:hypothetical protein
MRRSPIILAVVACLVSARPGLAEDPPADRDQILKQSELAMSKRLLDQAMAMAEGNVKRFQALTDAHSALQQRLAGLMTNAEGKRLAATLDPILARDVITYTDTPAIDPATLQANTKQAAALVDQLKAEREHITPGYVPPEGIITEAHSLSNWADEAMAKVKTRNTWIDCQLTAVVPAFDEKTAPTLQNVIKEFRRREVDSWAAARKAGIDQAKVPGEAAITEAARTAELEKMLQEARQKLAQAQTDLAQQKSEHDAAIARQRDSYTQAEADLRRQLTESAARRQVQEAQTDAIAKQGNTAAEKVKLTQEAKDPAIQTLLAPLLAKGHSQPGSTERQLEATPVSLSKLRAFGALERSEKGLTQLARAGMKKFGTTAALKSNPLYDRPEWGYPVSWSKWSQDQRDALLKAQDALNRLGPTLVEMGLLAE